MSAGSGDGQARVPRRALLDHRRLMDREVYHLVVPAINQLEQ